MTQVRDAQSRIVLQTNGSAGIVSIWVNRKHVSNWNISFVSYYAYATRATYLETPGNRDYPRSMKDGKL